MLQTILPERLAQLKDTELDDRIRTAREKLGRRLVILGHHYQRDEVIQFADLRGDSFKLAEWASTRKDEGVPRFIARTRSGVAALEPMHKL